jgi:dienelactone hydrolase
MNAGVREGFLGEVDDVLAAAEYLAGQEYLDRNRIYLGGHSTGGTLVLLVAECSNRFRAIFSFGPIDDVAGYGPEYLPFDASVSREVELRSPVLWLHCIKSPVFVFEGAGGNLRALKALDRATANPRVHFYAVKGADHFTILAPVSQMVAEAMLRDNGLLTQLAFDGRELNRAFGK